MIEAAVTLPPCLMREGAAAFGGGGGAWAADEALPWNAAEHAAGDSAVGHDVRGKLGFLKHRHFLRDGARLHQFPGLNQARDRLD